MINLNIAATRQSDAWEHVESRYLKDGSACVFRGLDGDKDHTYKIVIDNLNTNLASYVGLNLNNDTGANYDYLSVTITSGSNHVVAATSGANEFVIGSAMSANEQAYIEATIVAIGGFTAGHLIASKQFTNGSGAGDIHLRTGVWSDTDAVNTITLTFDSPLAGAWDSKVSLFRLSKN